LLASVRTQRQDMTAGHDGVIIAQIDFLGEGDEERLRARSAVSAAV